MSLILFPPPLSLYPFVILFTLAPFVSPSFTICLFLSLSLSLFLLQFPFSFGFLYCHSAPLPMPRTLRCKLIYHSVLAIFPLLHLLYFYFNCLFCTLPVSLTTLSILLFLNLDLISVFKFKFQSYSTNFSKIQRHEYVCRYM